MRKNVVGSVLALFVCLGVTGCECSATRVDPDGGVAVCTLRGGASQGCSDPPPVLSDELCRCASRYYWDGTSCGPTAACFCYEGCERLFESDLACEAAHASCRGDAGP